MGTGGRLSRVASHAGPGRRLRTNSENEFSVKVVLSSESSFVVCCRLGEPRPELDIELNLIRPGDLGRRRVSWLAAPGQC